MSRIVRLACRYGLASGVCLVLHNIIVIVADGLNQSLTIAVIESFFIVVIVGYLLHSRFTFAREPSWPAFLRYGAAMAMNLPGSILILWIFARWLGWPMTAAAPVATSITIVLNFVASRWAVENSRSTHAGRHECLP